MPEMSIPHLKTKLNIPPQRPNLVLRPRLVACLEEGQHYRNRLTLISAKAGSGKTTLVSEWVHQQQRPAAWLSLDAGDSDPRRFFSYLAAALGDIDIKISNSILAQLETPHLPQAENLVAELINTIAADLVPFLIVLDDYHHIQNEWIHQVVAYLIEYQPPELHLICITRVDPPLPLARLRVHSQISEIRDDDLRFTPEEAVQFFNGIMELNLSAEAVSTLEGRTEGWIAGLQLAAISVKGRKQESDLAAFIKAFGGTNRFVLDYLMDEVLKQQSSSIQDFLMETAILERLCGDLCDTVRFGGSEKPGNLTGAEFQNQRSQTVLEVLERSNLFLVPLDYDRQWYRYHHLFADLLTSTLKQRKSDEHIRDLHRRASRWHHSEGNLEEAMSHAMAAQDYEQAALMIDENFANMFSRSDVPVLLGWIEKLPEQVLRGRPWIAIHRANTLVLGGRPDEVDPLIDDIEKQINPKTPRYAELMGYIAAIRAYAANLNGDAEIAAENAVSAKKHLPDDHVTGLSMAAYALADTLIACDDLEDASQELLLMLRAGEKSGQLMIIIPALCELAGVRKAQGQLHRAKELLDKAYQWLVDQDSLGYRLRCSYEFGIADLLREWNQLDEAYQHAIIGDEYRKRLGGYLMVGDLTLMRVHQAHGDSASALDALDAAEQVMGAHKLQLSTSIDFKTSRVLQWLAVGDLETANRWADECDGGSEREQIALARLYLALGQATVALQILDQQRALAVSGGRTGRLIEILSLQALALKLQDRFSEARSVLSQALSLARPEDYMRIFLDLGQPLYELLEQIVAQGPAAKTRIIGDYAHVLMKAYQQEGQIQTPKGNQALVSPLTDRELDVLRLLAEGLSNKMIADKLVVAPSTVKQHLKNIFGKLNVHNRTQAVARGRELEIL